MQLNKLHGVLEVIGTASTTIHQDSLSANWDPNLLGCYPGTDNTYFNTVSTGDFTLYNSPAFRNTTPKNFKFDGVDDYMETTAPYAGDALTIDLSQPYTIGMWVKMPQDAEDLTFEKTSAIGAHYDQYSFHVWASGGKIYESAHTRSAGRTTSIEQDESGEWVSVHKPYPFRNGSISTWLSSGDEISRIDAHAPSTYDYHNNYHSSIRVGDFLYAVRGKCDYPYKDGVYIGYGAYLDTYSVDGDGNISFVNQLTWENIPFGDSDISDPCRIPQAIWHSPNMHGGKFIFVGGNTGITCLSADHPTGIPVVTDTHRVDPAS